MPECWLNMTEDLYYMLMLKLIFCFFSNWNDENVDNGAKGFLDLLMAYAPKPCYFTSVCLSSNIC